MEPREVVRPSGRVDMPALVGRVLAGGIVASLALLSTGLLWQWIATGRLGFDYTLPRTSIARFVAGEVTGALHQGWSPRRLVNFGIIVLLLTPYLRVLLSMIYFSLVERNYKYAAMTGFVSTVLSTTLFLR